MNDYEKAVRTEVQLNRGRTITWLAGEVNRETGLRIDGSFINKVLKGRVKSVRTVKAIEKLVGVPAPDGYALDGISP